jgi:protein N-terminal methyltransferase
MEVHTGHCEVIPALPEPSNVTAACENSEVLGAATDIEITDTENNEPSDENYYNHGANYWAQVPATVDGMLGGFGYISHTDIQGSEAFLRSIFKVRHS